MMIEMEDSSSYIVFSFLVRRWGMLQKMMQSNGYGHKWLIGSWKGKEEPACIVNAVNFRAIFNSGLLDDQDCFMELGPMGKEGRPAALLWPFTVDSFDAMRKRKQPKGTFQEVDLDNLRAFESWTFDPSTGKAFITAPEAQKVGDYGENRCKKVA